MERERAIEITESELFYTFLRRILDQTLQYLEYRRWNEEGGGGEGETYMGSSFGFAACCVHKHWREVEKQVNDMSLESHSHNTSLHSQDASSVLWREESGCAKARLPVPPPLDETQMKHTTT